MTRDAAYFTKQFAKEGVEIAVSFERACGHAAFLLDRLDAEKEKHRAQLAALLNMLETGQIVTAALQIDRAIRDMDE